MCGIFCNLSPSVHLLQHKIVIHFVLALKEEIYYVHFVIKWSSVKGQDMLHTKF